MEREKGEKKGGNDMLKGLLITIAGILVFLPSLSQSRLDGYPAFWTGMIISAIGMSIFLRKFFEKF